MQQNPVNYSQNSMSINATAEVLFRAFTDPEALSAWQAPGAMTAVIHHFELSIGGGYKMSLFYPNSTTGSPGKTAANEARFIVSFLELLPCQKILKAITFESAVAAYSGEMMME